MFYFGIIEKEVVCFLIEWLQDNGVYDWLYKLFVWFGDCIVFEGFLGFKYMGGFNFVFFLSNW